MPTLTYEKNTGASEGLLATLYMDTLKASGNWRAHKHCGSFYDVVSRCVGTGGSLAGGTTCLLPSTGSYVILESTLETHAPPLGDTADKIALIRSTLSFNVKELAGVLRVERPTIYAWIAGSAQPQKHNRERIDAVAALAHEWTSLHTRPLGALRKETGPDGRSVMALLESGVIDTQQVRKLLTAAASKLKQQGQTRKGIGLAERAKAHGVVLSESPDAQREIDRLTGKRIATE